MYLSVVNLDERWKLGSFFALIMPWDFVILWRILEVVQVGELGMRDCPAYSLSTDLSTEDVNSL